MNYFHYIIMNYLNLTYIISPHLVIYASYNIQPSYVLIIYPIMQPNQVLVH